MCDIGKLVKEVTENYSNIVERVDFFPRFKDKKSRAYDRLCYVFYLYDGRYSFKLNRVLFELEESTDHKICFIQSSNHP